jgi:hypothetical protein
MKHIWEWFAELDTAARLQLLEAAAYFDPQSYNSVFQRELDELLNRISDEGTRQEIMELKSSFDFSNYILNSLKRVGIKSEDQQQEYFHQIAVRLLVSPGKLFTGWQPGKHGPLDRRFRAATWNSIRNILEKRRNRRKWMQNADPTAIAERTPQRSAGNSEIIDVFRRLVKERLGELALSVLDQRLSGGETKELVGIGTQSAFYVKQSVQSIKELAQRFAVKIGDNSFADMVSKAMAAESETIEKRKKSLAARQSA